WPASIPLISPTTLLVSGSMMLTLSPAKFVWRTRSLDCCAARKEDDTAHRATPAKSVRLPRNICLLVIFDSICSTISFNRGVHQEARSVPQQADPVSALANAGGPPLFRGCSRHECFQRLPVRILLRGELLAAAVMGIAAGLLSERMLDQRALQDSGRGHPLDQLEILARLLFAPAHGAGRQRHQVERRVVGGMANNASRVASTLGEEDGLHLGLEEIVIQRCRCGGGARLALRRPQRPGRSQEQ